MGCDLVNSNLLVGVGPGGDFATINAALASLSEKRPAYVPGGFTAEVRMLAGFEMAEQVLMHRGIDLGWIVLTSEDAEVPILRDALTFEVLDRYPAFSAYENCTLPIISALFNMTEDGPADFREAFFLYSSKVTFGWGAGCKNAGDRGLHLSNGSIGTARMTNFDGAKKIGVRLANASKLQWRNSTAKFCGETALAVAGVSELHGHQSDVSGSVVAISSLGGAEVLFDEGLANDTTGEFAVQGREGGKVYMSRAQVQRAAGDAIRCAGAGSSVDAADTLLDNPGRRVVGNSEGGVVNIARAKGRFAGLNAVETASGAETIIVGADLGGAQGLYGIVAIDKGEISGRAANCRKGPLDDPNDIKVLRGGIIHAHTAIGGLSQAANIPTGAGIIFK